jgi:hypothetical protein
VSLSLIINRLHFSEHFSFDHRNLLKKKERIVYPCSEFPISNTFDLREEGNMPSSCEEYRQQQQLLALKKRLAEDNLKPEDREELERLVQELERKLKI